MAIKDDATLVIGAGNFYTAPTGTVVPTVLNVAPITPWDEVGHTSLADVFAWAVDGGEATILGTLQNKQLRTTYSVRTETFTVVVQQWDESALKKFFGTNATTELVGVEPNQIQWFHVPASNAAPFVGAFLGIFIDGMNYFGIYAPKAEMFRGDVPGVSTDGLASLPLKITPLIDGDNDYAYMITPLGAVEA